VPAVWGGTGFPQECSQFQWVLANPMALTGGAENNWASQDKGLGACFSVWQGPLFAVLCDAGGPCHAQELCGHW